MGDPPVLLGLYPLGSQPPPPPPLHQLRAQADDVQEGPLHPHPTRRDAAVVGVEVAVNSDAARLGEGDRLADLPPFEESLIHEGEARLAPTSLALRVPDR